MSIKRITTQLCTFGWTLLISSAAMAQIPCQIKVLQDHQEIIPSKLKTGLRYALKPQSFQIEVSPTACAPTIAIMTDVATIKEILEKPLIYANRWAYSMAADPSDSDQLLRWAAPATTSTAAYSEAKKPPNPASFTGQQYLKLCDELGFCPKVYPIFSSGHPFKPDLDADKSRATFHRLSDHRTMADAGGRIFISAIYTLWRKLPAEFPMAEPQELLFKPEILVFSFYKNY